MSRYVDLDGLTWDGSKLSSKIQEVKTKYGFMQAITIGWLYSENVPHIDLDFYSECLKNSVKSDTIQLVIESVIPTLCELDVSEDDVNYVLNILVKMKENVDDL